MRHLQRVGPTHATRCIAASNDSDTCYVVKLHSHWNYAETSLGTLTAPIIVHLVKAEKLDQPEGVPRVNQDQVNYARLLRQCAILVRSSFIDAHTCETKGNRAGLITV